MEKSLKELAELTQTQLVGDGDVCISGVNSLEDACLGQISFLANKKYSKYLDSTNAEAVIVPEGIKTKKPVLVSKNPYADFVKILTLFAPKVPMPSPGIHATAIVDSSAILGEHVAIGPLCIIEANVKIGTGSIISAQSYIGQGTVVGEQCIIYPQVIIREECIIGNRVILQPGVVIGGDGFGFAPHEGRYHKIPQIGNVIIADDVEVGANTTIDRAALNSTKIAQGTKIDNLVMIAHNVEIGEHTVIAGQAGMSGSTKIGANVMIGGQVGTAGHMKIGDRVIVGGQSGVTKDIEPGLFINGYPAKPHSQYMRELAEIGKMSELRKKVKDLERRLEDLEKNGS